MARQLPLPLTLSDEARFSNFYLPSSAAEGSLLAEGFLVAEGSLLAEGSLPAKGSLPAEGSSRVEAARLLIMMGSAGELRDSGLALGVEFAVYLWGPSGSGKSHLAQACCRQFVEAGRRTMYLPLAELTNYPPREVLLDLEYNDLLCIDDIDVISGRGEWQQALFDLYNRARDSACRLVFVGRNSPGNSNIALADLESRLAAATGFALPAYTDQERAAILNFRAERQGLSLPREVVHYLLSRMPRDMSALIECLRQLDREALAGQRRLTVPFVKTVLGL